MGGVDVTSEAAVWRELRAGRSRGLREEVILSYLPLVRSVVRRLHAALPQSVLTEDLEAYGTIGLIEAVDRFDPDQGIRFETFAWPRIRGAILDHLRSLDMAGRTDRQRARRIQDAYDRETLHHGRPATDEEVAEALGIPVEELLHEIGRLQNLIVYHIEDMIRGAEMAESQAAPPGIITTGPVEEVERAELIEALQRGLRGLSDREKLVLGLYYYERLTLAEIGVTLGLTESRVCQIQSAALLRLRAGMTQLGYLNADR